jgi:hypothetical protein
MTPADILKSLQAHLAPYVKARKGTLSIADDDWNALEILANSPAGFLVILHWAGDKPQDEDGEYEGVTLNQLEAIVRVAKRPVAKPGADLVAGVAGGQEPLYVLISQLRAKVRAWRKDGNDQTNEGEYRYLGCESVLHPGDGFPLRAFKLKFGLQAAVSTDDGTE